MTSKTSDWLEALNMAVNSCFPNGIFSQKGKPEYKLPVPSPEAIEKVRQVYLQYPDAYMRDKALKNLEKDPYNWVLKNIIIEKTFESLKEINARNLQVFTSLC